MTTKTRSADYSGHCQACGHLQKLPSEKLALHGYKVTHGYFSGTCAGSKNPPFEVSCDLVKRFIEDAKHQLRSVEKFQASLRKPAATSRCYVYVRYETTRTTRTWGMTRTVPSHAYRWENVELLQVFAPFSGGTSATDGYYVYSFVDQDGKAHGGTTMDRISGKQAYDLKRKDATAQDCLLATCTDFNETYAKWQEHEADSLRRYIKWQTERVKTWKPAPLFPVAHKEKAVGFEPTKAKY